MATIAQISQAFDDQDDHQHQSASIGYGSNESTHSKSPLHNFNIFKSLTSDKKTKDGQPPKRRGPKPDSKPALTRRQELNRQAQRTHRERKEMYIKALEQEVLRLKEIYGDVTRERDNYAEENRKLRELLAAHGLSSLLDTVPAVAGKITPSSSGSISGSYPAPSSASSRSPPPPKYGPIGGPPTSQNGNDAQRPNTALDYDRIGIDFVLALERPCMDHMQMLCVKSQDCEAEISGHALMATCPPESHIIEHPDVQYPHKMPDMQPSDLMKLLDLSNRLALDGEITPIMAWAFLLRDARIRELTHGDFKGIEAGLLTKVRCYGFGAVLEEFEVKDALENIFAARMDVDYAP